MPKPDTTFVEFMAEVHTDLCDFAYPIGMIPDTRHAGELSALLADRQCGSALRDAIEEAHAEYREFLRIRLPG
jgi:hypothetical protein